ncbi:hypothetical protein [Aliarcobacter cryaerophilus]|uniref:hypothetical protein n=1 Tax=Aliarcobacter cryaerophilus TaxID=28198 RepID=UPI0021B1D411|nr:hypothetical protein [Aliarcobacter cryaerophilus]MCT7498727.1 hypothetical protein [Aliarcobacter cryaerophilus]MCT7544378.1 hypothetical protein [Aliarcobacter cryaerophilus]
MNSETIRKAIQNIIVISDFKTKVIEDYWNNELKIINNLNPDYAIGKFQSKQTYYKI